MRREFVRTRRNEGKFEGKKGTLSHGVRMGSWLSHGTEVQRERKKERGRNEERTRANKNTGVFPGLKYFGGERNRFVDTSCFIWEFDIVTAGLAKNTSFVF
jgi:hypothetical protein